MDDTIKLYGGWKSDVLSTLRAVITHANPAITEEIKWRMPSLPEGRPVWSHNGILCIAEVFKNDIKLVFFKGAQMKDTHNLFNARLNSKTDRAIEFREGDTVYEAALHTLVIEAVELNTAQSRK